MQRWRFCSFSTILLLISEAGWARIELTCERLSDIAGATTFPVNSIERDRECERAGEIASLKVQRYVSPLKTLGPTGRTW